MFSYFTVAALALIFGYALGTKVERATQRAPQLGPAASHVVRLLTEDSEGWTFRKAVSYLGKPATQARHRNGITLEIDVYGSSTRVASPSLVHFTDDEKERVENALEICIVNQSENSETERLLLHAHHPDPAPLD